MINFKVGGPFNPNTNIERVLFCAVRVLGAGIVATIYGQVSHLIAQFGRVQAKYQGIDSFKCFVADFFFTLDHFHGIFLGGGGTRLSKREKI